MNNPKFKGFSSHMCIRIGAALHHPQDVRRDSLIKCKLREECSDLNVCLLIVKGVLRQQMIRIPTHAGKSVWKLRVSLLNI